MLSVDWGRDIRIRCNVGFWYIYQWLKRNISAYHDSRQVQRALAHSLVSIIRDFPPIIAALRANRQLSNPQQHHPS